VIDEGIVLAEGEVGDEDPALRYDLDAHLHLDGIRRRRRLSGEQEKGPCDDDHPA
jgi:hypothetical protein